MPSTLDARFKTIRLVLILTLVLNWGVAFLKIFYGWISDSTSIFADGLHSLTDGFSNIIGLFGVWIASQPVDDNHPYGHKKMETFATLGVALLIFLMAIELVKHAVSKLMGDGSLPQVEPASYLIMVVSMVVNTSVWIYEKRMGEKLSSDLLVADSGHSKSDLFVSTSVLISLVIVQMGFPTADAIVTLLIALLIGFEGIQIVRSGVGVLTDEKVFCEKEIKESLLKIPQVINTHKIRSRGRDDDVHVDLHLVVAPQMSIQESHDLEHSIQDKLKEEFPGVTDVKIHFEPARKDKIDE